MPSTLAVTLSSVARNRPTAPTEKYSSPRRKAVVPATSSRVAREISSSSIVLTLHCHTGWRQVRGEQAACALLPDMTIDKPGNRLLVLCRIGRLRQGLIDVIEDSVIPTRFRAAPFWGQKSVPSRTARSRALPARDHRWQRCVLAGWYQRPACFSLAPSAIAASISSSVLTGPA